MSDPSSVAPHDQSEATAARARLQDQPTLIYVDGISTHYFAPGISKMHFYRFDPDPAAKEPAKVIDIFQLAMPTAGFVSMVYFFQHRLRAMIARGEVTQQMLAAAEALWPSDGNERS